MVIAELDFFFFNDPATTDIYTLSLHDALPICASADSPDSPVCRLAASRPWPGFSSRASTRRRFLRIDENPRSEEHTSELQSQSNIVCRLLLEKKKIPEVAITQLHEHTTPYRVT